ncbi:YbaB/EbfC family nucleoid-associated protein [Streptomyces sp. NPDC093228]|uniref:YbaB/EbfC family nucleoid-associated protein n=1 Tax=Streptomyces sp. NPDC093228 TaxID=3155070 RepID=UPI00343322D6
MDLDDSLGIRKLLDTARQLQQDLARSQDELRGTSAQGTAGGGAVKVTIDGRGALQNLAISPVVADPGNAQGLADLIVSAVRAAQETMATRHEERLVPLLEALRADLRPFTD